jgi:hypothetical protein
VSPAAPNVPEPGSASPAAAAKAGAAGFATAMSLRSRREVSYGCCSRAITALSLIQSPLPFSRPGCPPCIPRSSALA